MVAEKKEEMKRRDFLFKAAEAAALALFGSMGLAEVIKTVVGEIKRRTAVDQLASQVAKHLGALQQRVEKCKNGKKFTCEGYQDRVDCGWFDCRIVFTCIGGDFSCEQPSLFDCEPSVRFSCYVYSR